MRRKNPTISLKRLSKASRVLYQKIYNVQTIIRGSSRVPQPVKDAVRSAYRDFLDLLWGYEDITTYDQEAAHSVIKAVYSSLSAVIDVYLYVDPDDPLGYIRKVLDSAEKSVKESLLVLERQVRPLGASSLVNDTWSLCKELLAVAAEAEAIVRESLG